MFSLIFASRCKLLIGRKKKLKYRCGLREGGFGIWSTLVILLYTERENHESYGVYATTVLGRGWDEERRYSARIPPRRRRRVSRIDGRKREKNGSKVAVVGLLGSLTVGQMRAPHQGRTKNLLNIAISLRFSPPSLHFEQSWLLITNVTEIDRKNICWTEEGTKKKSLIRWWIS